MTAELLISNFETLADAPNGIPKLRELILQLAVQGKLVPQDPKDEPASVLLEKIRKEKERLIAGKKIKKSDPPVEIKPEQISFALPASWQWVRIGEIAHDWGQKKPDQRFVYLDVSAINNKIGIISEPVQLVDAADAPSRARKVVRRGTVIYSTVRPYLLNTSIIAKDYEYEAIASTAFAIFHPFTGIVDRYLHYYLRSSAFTGFVEQEMKGMAYPAISDSKIQLGIVSLPPSSEQNRIVAKVDQLMVLCDELERKQNEKNTLRLAFNDSALTHLVEAKEPKQFTLHWNRIKDNFDMLYDTPETVGKLRQTILQLAVQGKLVPQDPKDEPASVLLEKIRKEKERLIAEKKIKKSDPLPAIKAEEYPYELPKGWEWCRFIEIATIASRLVSPYEYQSSLHLAPDNIEKGSGKILSLRSVQDDNVKSSNHLFFAGQIVYSKIRPNLSKAVLVDFDGLCSADMYPIDAHIHSKYLLLYILSKAFLTQSVKSDTRVAMPKINQNELNAILVALPPLAEQRRIVAEVDQLMALCDEMEKQLAAAEEVNGALLESVVWRVGKGE